MNKLNGFLIVCLSCIIMTGCDSGWSFGFGGTKEKPQEPTQEEISQTEDADKLKVLAENTRKLLEAEKQKNKELEKQAQIAKEDANKARLEAQKKDIERSKAELSAERARFDAEKGHMTTSTWTGQMGTSIEQINGNIFLFMLYGIAVVMFFFIYHILITIEQKIAAYLSLAFMAVPAFVVAYAAIQSESMGMMISVGGTVAGFIFSVAKHRPQVATQQKKSEAPVEQS